MYLGVCESVHVNRDKLFGNIFLCIEKARGVAAAIFGENSVRVKMVLDRFGIIAVDRVLSGSFSSHSKGGGRPESVQKVIRYVYYDLSSMHLKGFLGAICQLSPFRDIEIVASGENGRAMQYKREPIKCMTRCDV